MSTHFSRTASVFLGRELPEEATVVGYGAIIDALTLEVPTPRFLAAISQHNRKYDTDQWKVFPNRYLPTDSLELSQIQALHNHLVFALKYEGINLLIFKRLTQHYCEAQLLTLVSIEPTGQYTRRIWFLMEWLMGRPIAGKSDLPRNNYVSLVDESIQYAAKGEKSSRHKILNNLPGTIDFCPLVHRTPVLDTSIQHAKATKEQDAWLSIHKEVWKRASAFLLLKDSKASFAIEGESPKSMRTARWGRALGQAGMRDLSKSELIRLQQLVLENSRFLKLGYRTRGGFVGEHDRSSGEPLPDHISAKWQDVETLMDGLLATEQLLYESEMDPVVFATVISFGFVFIHPFEDGNGRIHRYLLHHILARTKFVEEGMVFPVSAAILEDIKTYRTVLESYSLPLLDFIHWKETADHNVEVLNDTIDYYRFFDATQQAEFLHGCIKKTLEDIIPKEVDNLIRYDKFQQLLDGIVEMPNSMVALLVRFLEQHHGQLSIRARQKEFAALTGAEVDRIEKLYRQIFDDLTA